MNGIPKSITLFIIALIAFVLTRDFYFDLFMGACKFILYCLCGICFLAGCGEVSEYINKPRPHDKNFFIYLFSAERKYITILVIFLMLLYYFVLFTGGLSMYHIIGVIISAILITSGFIAFLLFMWKLFKEENIPIKK